MSRILKVMIALLAIAAIAAPVMAEDRLGLSGQMRVRGWHKDTGGSSTSTYADQRLRIGGKFSIAEGVSVTFRTDVTEATWGANAGFGSGRLPASNANQWDRAHMDLASGNMHFRGGQQYIAFGNYGFDAQDNGLTFNLKGAVPVTLFYMLDDNAGADSFWAGARVAHSMDSYGASLFAVLNNDDAEDVYMFGATFETKMDALAIAAEAEFFTGDAATGVDAMGTQVMVDVSAGMGAATVGGQVFYAMGADAGEVQYQLLGNDFGGQDPLFDVGTGLSNEQIGLGRPYDVFGGGAGVMALRGYANVKASDALSVGASVAYAEPEEDNNTASDSLLGLAAGASYALMSNTKLDVQVEYIDIDAPGMDEIFNAGVGLFVNF